MTDDLIQEALEEHQPSHIFALFSGGHDSLCSTALAAKHPAFTSAVHINTGIGIQETREYVRKTCAEQDWPLIELYPDGKTYLDLIAEKGMPYGPRSHNTMYYWLKQRQVRRLVADHKQGRYGRIGLVTGIRSSESVRRMSAVLSVPIRRFGAQIWINPILDWTKTDCNNFMEQEGLQRSPVVDLLHRSGECLCGALARRDEFAEIEAWYPDAAQEIRSCEALAAEYGHRENKWATPFGRTGRLRFVNPLCSDCDGDFDFDSLPIL